MSTPLSADSQNTNHQFLSTEERIELAQKTNKEWIQKVKELENTIKYTWSQLKDTPNAPPEILDQYGHISSKGLMWIESTLPKEHLELMEKYKSLQRELEKTEKKDPEWWVLQYSLLWLGWLLLLLMVHSMWKISKQDYAKLKRDLEEVWGKYLTTVVRNAHLEAQNDAQNKKIWALEDAGNDETPIITETDEGDTDTTLPWGNSLTEWFKGAFLYWESFSLLLGEIHKDLSWEIPSALVIQLLESTKRLNENAQTQDMSKNLSTMSESLIAFARNRNIAGTDFKDILVNLSLINVWAPYSFRHILQWQSFDNAHMTQIETNSQLAHSVSRVISLPVMNGENCIEKWKVECK